MNTPDPSPDWLDQVQSGRPTGAESAALRRLLSARPREAARLEDELALNAALDLPLKLRLPPRASTNFSSRVWAEIDRSPASTRHFSGWRLLEWIQGFQNQPAATATVAALLVAGTLGWTGLRTHQRTVLAVSLAEVSRTTPDVEILRDFESIRALTVKPEAGDLALIAALDTPSNTSSDTPSTGR